MFNLDGLKQITEAVALNYLASHIPLDSLQCLNEPIDLYSINAKMLRLMDSEKPKAKSRMLQDGQIVFLIM